MNELIILLCLSAVSLIAAVYAIVAKKNLNAVVAGGVVSLMASIIFLLAAAPDVAMTEAAIGSGLTTVVFLYALKHVEKRRRGHDD
jgi:energy-converting hydrogenase B subunit D